MKRAAWPWRVPTDCRELAEVTAREHGNVHRSAALNAAAVARLLDRCDAWRRPARFAELLLACECDARGRLGLKERPYPQRPRLWAALQAALSVNTAQVAQAAADAGLAGPQIGEHIREARVQAIGRQISSPINIATTLSTRLDVTGK